MKSAAPVRPCEALGVKGARPSDHSFATSTVGSDKLCFAAAARRGKEVGYEANDFGGVVWRGLLSRGLYVQPARGRCGARASRTSSAGNAWAACHEGCERAGHVLFDRRDQEKISAGGRARRLSPGRSRGRKPLGVGSRIPLHSDEAAVFRPASE